MQIHKRRLPHFPGDYGLFVGKLIASIKGWGPTLRSSSIRALNSILAVFRLVRTISPAEIWNNRRELIRELPDWIQSNRVKLVQVAVVLSLLLACVFVAPKVVSGRNLPQQGLFLLVVAVMGLVFLIRNPSLAIVSILPIGMVIPFTISTGTGTALNGAILMLAILLGLWVFEMIVGQSFKLIDSWPVESSLALSGSAVLAFGFGQLPWFHAGNASLFAQIGGTLLFVLSVGAFLLVGHRINERGLTWMVWSFLGLSFFYIVARFTTDQNINFTRPLMNLFQAGAFGSVFWVWVLCLAVGQIIFNVHLAWIHRAGLCLLVALVWFVAFILGRDWTSGWLPALAGIGVMAWLGFPKLRFPLVLFAIFAAAIGWKVLYGVYESMVLTPDNLYSQMTRVEAWKILLRIFQENPIFGLGPANYYDYTPLFPILGYSVSFNSHSNYIDLLVETGILGFGCFVWFMTTVFRLSLKLQHQVQAGFQKGFVISVMGGVVGTLVAAAFGDWVIPFVYNIGFDGFRGSVIAWIFMGGLVAVDRFTRQKAQVEN